MEYNNTIDINDLVEKIDIVEYISQFVELEERNDEYVGISPFSGCDTDPSFTVTPSTNLWYDFSASVGGNILCFIQKYHKVKFKDALKIACEYVGGDVKTLPPSLEVTKYIKKFKPSEFKRKQPKYKKLPDDIMSKYDTNPNKLISWLNEGISREVLEKYQVRYDTFSNRIVFPIRDEQGNIINIKGRTLDPEYKTKRISKYQNFYDIGITDYVFNLNFAKENIKKLGFVVIFEAEKAVMLAETYGIGNSIALMTGTLNDYQLELLIKLGVDVLFALDKDKDVTKDKNIAKLKRYVKVQYLKDTEDLLGEKDSPIDKGRDVFIELYKKRKTLR